MQRRLLLVILSSLVAVPVHALGTGTGPSVGFPAGFDGGSIILLPRDAALLDAQDGRLVIRSERDAFDLTIAEMDLITGVDAPLLHDGNGQAYPDPTYDEFPTRFYVGRVTGDAASTVALTITRVGVSAFIQQADDVVFLEPLVFHQRSSPPGLTLVHRPEDRAEPFHLVDEVVMGAAGVPPSRDVGASQDVQSLGVANRPVKLVVDSQFYSAFYPCWYCKADSVFAYAISAFGNEFTWDVSIWGRVGCTTTTCDSNWGITSTSPSSLLSNFGSYQQALRNLNGETWELAQLMSGKNLDGSIIGIAYAGGRYSVGQFVNEGTTYTPNDDYEAGIISSHELAHNFEATHYDATTTHCHVATSPCPSTSLYTHATLMHSSERNNPSSLQEHHFDIDSTNQAVMDACNNYNFNGMSYSPQAHTC